MRTLPALRTTLLPARSPESGHRGVRDELVVVGHFALRRTSEPESFETRDAWVEVPQSPRLGAHAMPPVEVAATHAGARWEHRAMTPLPTEGYLALHAATLPHRRSTGEDPVRAPSRVDSVAARRGYARVERYERAEAGLGLASSF